LTFRSRVCLRIISTSEEKAINLVSALPSLVSRYDEEKIHILCLQETQWTSGKSGRNARNTVDGFKLYYSAVQWRNPGTE